MREGCSGRTLVVQVQLILVVRTCFIILEVFSQLLIVGDRSVQRLASRKALPQFRPFLADLGISQQERSAVEVVPPLSILSSLPDRAVSDRLVPFFLSFPFLFKRKEPFNTDSQSYWRRGSGCSVNQDV